MARTVSLEANEVELLDSLAYIEFGVQEKSGYMLPEVNGLCIKDIAVFRDCSQLCVDLYDVDNPYLKAALDWLDDEGQDLFDAFVERENAL